MNLEEIEALEKLEKEAGGHPWHYGVDTTRSPTEYAQACEALTKDGPRECGVVQSLSDDCVVVTSGNGPRRELFVKFIAELRNAAPDLLAMARKWVEYENKYMKAATAMEETCVERIDALEAENAALRELVRAIADDKENYDWHIRAEKLLGER